jgi:hypothetical protein
MREVPDYLRDETRKKTHPRSLTNSFLNCPAGYVFFLELSLHSRKAYVTKPENLFFHKLHLGDRMPFVTTKCGNIMVPKPDRKWE